MDEPVNSNGIEQDPPGGMDNEAVLRRIIRLIVGIALVGQDALKRSLPLWEAEAARLLDEMKRASQAQSASGDGGIGEQANQDKVEPATPWFPQEWEYRLVGLALESPHYLRSGLSQLTLAPRKLWRFSAPLRLPLEITGVSDLLRAWTGDWLERLQIDMEHLEEVGRSEAEYSRMLGQVALRDGLDNFLQRLSENPEVQELVQSQTSGLTTEFVEEIRERTVSADSLIDGLVSRLFKREPRLPGKFELAQPIRKKRHYR